MNIQERISSLVNAFGDVTYIPDETFVSLCVADINGKSYNEKLNEHISEYWSEIYDLYEENGWAWMSSQDFSDKVRKELSTLSYFS